MAHNIPPSLYQHVSAECAPEGSAQCDGEGDEDFCGCSCHTTTEALPQTVAGMKNWHDDLWGLPGSSNPTDDEKGE